LTHNEPRTIGCHRMKPAVSPLTIFAARATAASCPGLARPRLKSRRGKTGMVKVHSRQSRTVTLQQLLHINRVYPEVTSQGNHRSVLIHEIFGLSDWGFRGVADDLAADGYISIQAPGSVCCSSGIGEGGAQATSSPGAVTKAVSGLPGRRGQKTPKVPRSNHQTRSTTRRS